MQVRTYKFFSNGMHKTQIFVQHHNYDPHRQ